MAWSWNLGYGSFEVIEYGTIWKPGYSFLFAWLYLTSFMRRCEMLVENCDLAVPLHSTPRWESPSKYCHTVWYRKTRMVWLPDGEKFDDMTLFNRFDTTPACDKQIDGQTDILRQHISALCIASRGKNWLVNVTQAGKRKSDFNAEPLLGLRNAR